LSQEGIEKDYLNQFSDMETLRPAGAQHDLV
jgi:hypothetical protein